MHLFRIVTKRTNKRKYDDSPCRDALTVLLFVFLLPYVISCLWGHIGEESDILFAYTDKQTEWIDTEYEVCISGKWGIRRMSMQEYLARKLEMIMPQDEEDGVKYELEALKAQAVLLRTELWTVFLEKTVTLQDDSIFYNSKNDYGEEETLYLEAVCETDGICLAYDGKPVKAAYFPISNGQTRNAAEVLQNENYPYLVSVECRQDILAEEFQSRVTLSKAEYCQLARNVFPAADSEEVWKRLELTYDSAEYVKEAAVVGHTCNGEIFRTAFGLNSSSFRAEWQEESVTFYVRGVGHGLGMSQYAANERAVSGESFAEILESYFFQAELVKIE